MQETPVMPETLLEAVGPVEGPGAVVRELLGDHQGLAEAVTPAVQPLAEAAALEVKQLTRAQDWPVLLGLAELPRFPGILATQEPLAMLAHRVPLYLKHFLVELLVLAGLLAQEPGAAGAEAAVTEPFCVLAVGEAVALEEIQLELRGLREAVHAAPLGLTAVEAGLVI